MCIRDSYHVGPVEQYLIASGRTFFGDMVYSDLHRMQIDFETVSYTHLLLGSLMAPAAPLASSHP